MSTFLALARRELGVYFVSPMAYIILTALLLISALVFGGSVESFSRERLPFSFEGTLYWMGWLLIVAGPLVTMRLVAEEKSRGTLETLMTAPVTDAQFVLAKFAAAVLFMLYLLVPTAGFVAVISRYGQVDLGAVACGYLGVALAVAATYSIGLFISALCANQITAGVITLVVVLILFFASFFGYGVSAEPWWREVMEVADLNRSVADFFKGVVDTQRLVYLLSVTCFFLFLTARAVQSRRWR